MESNNVNLVEQILEQGQRLRNAMVHTILDNNPFYTNVGTHKLHEKTDGKCKQFDECVNGRQGESNDKRLTEEEKNRFLSYLRGEPMSKEEEKDVLETFREMSNVDIFEATGRLNLSNDACECDTCKMYLRHSAKCHSDCVNTCPNKFQIPSLNLRAIDTRCDNHNNFTILNLDACKRANSLKVTIHSLRLTSEGNKKVYGKPLDKNIELPLSVNHSYFIEYSIPDSITKFAFRSKSKVDSGLESNNSIRLCSKKFHNNAIYFKQISFHDITNLSDLNINKISLKFQVSCRTLKQKCNNLLGCSIFCMRSLFDTRYLSKSQELPLMLSEDVPITLGSLKISVELGCDGLYFGKEFIDALNTNKESEPDNSNYTSDPSISLASQNRHNNSETSSVASNTNYEIVNQNKLHTSKPAKIHENKTSTSPTQDRRKFVETQSHGKATDRKSNSPKQLRINQDILFCFIYIGQARYFIDVADTIVTCRLFSSEDILQSRLIYNDSNPLYNFNQIVPLIYDEHLLDSLRDNHLVLEFLEKYNGKQSLIGVIKISLHQFYIAFRNFTILKYLKDNKDPIIGADSREPICHPTSGQIYGQAEVLFAIGTELQINNLKFERGFKNVTVTFKETHISNEKCHKNELSFKDKVREKIFRKGFHSDRSITEKNFTQISQNIVTDNCKTSSILPSIENSKIDKSTQCVLEMDDQIHEEHKQNMLYQSGDVLETFLAKLLQQKQKNMFVESSTNTESVQGVDSYTQVNTSHIGNMVVAEPSTVNVRSTSELFESLQKALSTPQVYSNNETHTAQNQNSFKAKIVINGAINLPHRKKCKSRKAKGKNIKHEDILPSTYVTFEIVGGIEPVATDIVHKSKNPEWNFKCDVHLPVDLLTNNHKLMIFKVWKKAHNSPFVQNSQTDTVIGFVGIDLTVLMTGLPSVSGWFNIMDFSNKCNGQVKIEVAPLENISRFTKSKECLNQFMNFNTNAEPNVNPLEVCDEPAESLSRALKRKFIELDEMTQRLRLRLSNVTKDDSDESATDDFVEQFERDINTLCIEEDYDTVNFEDKDKSNMQEAEMALLQIQDPTFEKHTNKSLAVTNNFCTESMQASVVAQCTCNRQKPNADILPAVDKELIAGKQKIDKLLEKLSLLTDDADMFCNRYVSGCSSKADDYTKQDDDVKEDVDSGRKCVNIDTIIEPDRKGGSTSLLYGRTSCGGSSCTSSLVDFSKYSAAPEDANNAAGETSSVNSISSST